MHTPPLDRFLKSVGRIQHHLHTVVVGLASVETGNATKPENLDILWKPADPVGSAREARRFILRATIVLFAEDLKEYATQVLKFRAAARAEEIPSLKSADRIRGLARPGDVEPSYLTIAPLIVSNWRNRIVHHGSNANLTSAEKERFLDQGESIRATYKNVDVSRLLDDFECDRPTLKDVTVLFAMSIRFAKAVDSNLPLPTCAQHVKQWLDAEKLTSDVLLYEKMAANGGSSSPRSRGRQFLRTKSPMLAEPYFNHGVAL
jgi:hypothetical protein